MAEAAFPIGIVPESEPSVVPDAPIEISIPYRSREKGASRHFGFFPFLAKKPWPVVQEYIKHYSNPGDLVCDPFAGSGVTPVEALVLGRRAIAGDINPVARFITNMTAIAPVDLFTLREAYDRLEWEVRSSIEALDNLPDAEIASLLSALDYPRTSIPATVRRAGIETVDKLHTPQQLAGLTLLRDAIGRVEESVARDLLRVALSGTVRYCNIMYILPYDSKGRRRSPYRGDAGFLRRHSFSPATERQFYELPVWPTFERRLRSVIKGKEETNRLIANGYTADNFVLADVPASRIHEVTGEAQVDYCFTDPPYSNDIHFLDLSTLWAAWLGMDITEGAKGEELLLRGTTQRSRDQFAKQFAESAESIARSLKSDRWLTLVYKHRDLSLWQTIVDACEDSGLNFVNAVWQDVKIRSTRQVESPNINPKGDMYLNFRKMPKSLFDSVYGRHQPTQLPTLTNYVEHEIERLIVAYLGAGIELLTEGLIQQVLNSRGLWNTRGNLQGLAADIGEVLGGYRFVTWEPVDGKPLWVMSPNTLLDLSLEATDRARYYVFEYLRTVGEATEGEIHQHLLTRLAEVRDLSATSVDVTALLRNLGKEVAPRRWQLDIDRILDYKQLRLLFQPSIADELRQRIERRSLNSGDRLLRVDLEGIALLRDRSQEANVGNSKFEAHYGKLLEVLQTVLRRLETEFGDKIERVLGVGDWAQYGIDLRNLPYDEVVFLIVLRVPESPFSLYLDIADRVFSELDDIDILAQFRIETLSEWQLAVRAAEARGVKEVLGIPLLGRT